MFKPLREVLLNIKLEHMKLRTDFAECMESIRSWRELDRKTTHHNYFIPGAPILELRTVGRLLYTGTNEVTHIPLQDTTPIHSQEEVSFSHLNE